MQSLRVSSPSLPWGVDTQLFLSGENSDVVHFSNFLSEANLDIYMWLECVCVCACACACVGGVWGVVRTALESSYQPGSTASIWLRLSLQDKVLRGKHFYPHIPGKQNEKTWVSHSMVLLREWNRRKLGKPGHTGEQKATRVPGRHGFINQCLLHKTKHLKCKMVALTCKLRAKFSLNKIW